MNEPATDLVADLLEWAADNGRPMGEREAQWWLARPDEWLRNTASFEHNPLAPVARWIVDLRADQPAWNHDASADRAPWTSYTVVEGERRWGVASVQTGRVSAWYHTKYEAEIAAMQMSTPAAR